MQDGNQIPRFELRFRVTAKDYLALLTATKHTWAERLFGIITIAAYWGVALIATMPFMFSRSFRQTFEPYLGSFAPAVLVLVFGALLYCFHTFFLFPLVIRDTLEGQIIGRSENHIVVDDAGITSRVSETVTQVPWHAVLRVADANGCILLFIGRNSAVILPRRVFVSQQEADRLLAFANQKTGAAT